MSGPFWPGGHLTQQQLQAHVDAEVAAMERRRRLLRPWLAGSALGYVDQVHSLDELHALLEEVHAERRDRIHRPGSRQHDRQMGELTMLEQILQVLPAKTSDPSDSITPSAPEQRSTP